MSFKKPSLRIPVFIVATLVGLLAFYGRYIDRSDGGSTSAGGSAPAIVIAVHDGDTISVVIGRKTERVRLIGIDAPELAQKPWGQRAKRHLRELLGSWKVRVTTDVEPRDRYGRLLAYLWSSDGKLLNIEMIRDGYALLYTIPPNVRYAEQLRAAQNEAKEEKRGIWGKGGLEALPRQYRKEHPRR